MGSVEIIGDRSLPLVQTWLKFIETNSVDMLTIKKIDFSDYIPSVYDLDGRKLSIDFNTDRRNYHKKKGSIKSELISKALGCGKQGLRILDLSAGLGIDAIFLAQLGYSVTAIERNPLVFLSLQTAFEKLPEIQKINLQFLFYSAQEFLKTTSLGFDCIYFDPMFPDKKKSALPRQEMILFRNLVGADADSEAVIEQALSFHQVSRIVVKRPLKAPVLFAKPRSSIQGKLIRFDIYGGRG